jgi:hypothetical protein
MARRIAHNIDTGYSTFNNPGRDQINHYYNAPSGPCNHPSPPLSFNDAPIDLLSSHFTGRENELGRIGEVLGVVYGNVPSRCAVFGMQGMGKTQLVLQYAALSHGRQRYAVVFWMSGATVEKLNQGFAKVLQLVGHPDRDHTEQSVRLTSARRWFEESGIVRWILVLDNVAQEAVPFLREHLPRKNSNGNILLTTRTQTVAEAITSVAGQQHPNFELQAPALIDAATLLLREAGMNTGDPASTSASGAEELVKCVRSLPLAISHAASYAKQSGSSLGDVISIYRSKNKYEVRFNSSLLLCG